MANFRLSNNYKEKEVERRFIVLNQQEQQRTMLKSNYIIKVFKHDCHQSVFT